MATQPISDRFVPVEEYLSTVYEPDCEYDEGVVVERNLGEFEHAFLQAFFVTAVNFNMDSWGVFGVTEQRVQIHPTRFLVPDVCVLPLDAPKEEILTRPPLIVVEILSPEDTIRRAAKKAGDYLTFGIQHVWVIDPHARVAYRGTANGLELLPGGVFTIPGTAIRVSTSELFEKLDKIRARGSK
jgi:Uma2 family endonuclease